MIQDICCIGAGYVGGPTCAIIAAKNPHLRVTVVDLDQTRIDAWNSDQLPIYEPGLRDIVEHARDGSLSRRPNLFFSTDVESAIRNAQLIFISVNTPTKLVGVGSGKALDLTHVEAAARQIAEISTTDKIIVEKSTVPCGTAQSLREIFSELGRPDVHFQVLSNPEFLAEGTAIRDLLDPDRILIGSQRTPHGLAAAHSLVDVYAAWVPRDRIVDIDIGSSEMAKLAANCMLAQRISSINSLSALCEMQGADVSELARTVGMDERIGPGFLKASVGFGGSCFKKDVLSLVYMAESHHLTEVANYWRAVVDINEYQKARFTKRIISALNNTLSNKSIAVLGYAYKKDTSDTRESAATTVVGQLIADNANVRIFDPKVTADIIRKDLSVESAPHLVDRRVTVCDDVYSACSNAAAVVILTEWEMFKTDSVILSSVLSEDTPIFKPYDSTTEASRSNSISSEDDSVSTHSKDSEDDAAAIPPETPPTRPQSPDKFSTSAAPRVDWTRIASVVRRPRLVFDGRNIVDRQKLENIGFQVHSIGTAR